MCTNASNNWRNLGGNVDVDVDQRLQQLAVDVHQRLQQLTKPTEEDGQKRARTSVIVTAAQPYQLDIRRSGMRLRFSLRAAM